MRRRAAVTIGLGLVLAAAGAAGVYVTEPLLTARRHAPAARADPERLHAHVRALSTDLAPRTPRHGDNLDRAAEYIRRHLAAWVPDVAYQPFDVDGRTYRNVVARLGPAGADRIVVGAHYDAAGPGVGADDDASGVAGLLELARLLSAEPGSTRVELVAFTLEEAPYFRTSAMGSYVHAHALRREGARVRLMLSLEMIGYFSDAPGSQRYPLGALRLFYPSTGNFIVVVGRLGQAGTVRAVKRSLAEATDLDVRSMNAPRIVPGVDFSDHLNYWDLGYPAVMVTDTAFYRNRAYHGANDTAERLDYARMAEVVDGVHAAVRAFSERR